MPICFAIGQSIELKLCNLCLRKGLRTFFAFFPFPFTCNSPTFDHINLFKTNSNIIFMERSLFKFALLGVMFLISHSSFSQITERERPAEWKQLVKGARFMDRFLPMKGNVLSSDTWGADCVLPRYVDNGIEDGIWSYWGGNIRKGEDGKYHLFDLWLAGMFT